MYMKLDAVLVFGFWLLNSKLMVPSAMLNGVSIKIQNVTSKMQQRNEWVYKKYFEFNDLLFMFVNEIEFLAYSSIKILG